MQAHDEVETIRPGRIKRYEFRPAEGAMLWKENGRATGRLQGVFGEWHCQEGEVKVDARDWPASGESSLPVEGKGEGRRGEI